MRSAATLDQLPKTAVEYYDSSTRSAVYVYDYLGTDDAGHRVYQLLDYDGVPYSGVRVLLPYAEFKKKVLAWAKKYPNTPMGMQRWYTNACFSNKPPAWMPAEDGFEPHAPEGREEAP